MYVRVSHKGAGELLGFYKWWSWGGVEEVPHTQGHINVTRDLAFVQAELAFPVSEQG